MLRPAITEKLNEEQSVFSLVIAVAKRAREITDEIETKKRLLIEQNGGKLPTDIGDFEQYLESKPVKLAVEEFDESIYNFENHPEEDEELEIEG